MRRWLLRLLVALAGVAVAAMGLVFFILYRPIEVTVAESEAGVVFEVFGLGTVEARVLSRPGFEVGGTLMELHADHGDSVSAGAVLAHLHDAQQRAQVAKSEAGVLSAEAALHRAEALVEKAETVLRQEQEINRRRQVLVERETISVEAAQEAQMEADVAAADHAIALRDLELSKAALRNAQAQLQFDRVQLHHHALKAPFDALVIERHSELGAVLAPGAPLFTLVDPNTVWTLAYLDERRAGDVALGQQAEVRLRSLPNRIFRGEVVRIGIESDRVSEERRVYVRCSDCPEDFHLGEQAEVVIRTGTAEGALLVPETALDLADEREGTVWTVENGRLARRVASLGRRNLDGRVEITGGIPADAKVVIDRRPGLREGRAVRIGDETP
jgi:HlyD family secretion protein